MSALSLVSSLGQEGGGALALGAGGPTAGTPGPPYGPAGGGGAGPAPLPALGVRPGSRHPTEGEGQGGAHTERPTQHTPSLRRVTLRGPPGHTQPTQPTPPHQEPASPVELPLKGIQPALHVAPGPPAGAGEGDVQEAGGRGRAARQFLVLAAPAVPPEAEDVGHS